MPTRFLNSSILKWPDKKKVEKAFAEWSKGLQKSNSLVAKIGYFGSYAKGSWGVGSDLDVVVIVKNSKRPFERRPADFDAVSLPVPVDLLVYTENEWENVGSSFKEKIKWVFEKQN